MAARKFSLGNYLKEKIGYKIGDRAANILMDCTYVGNDAFAFPFAFRASAEAAWKAVFENQLPSYVDFSTPANSIFSLGKIGGAILSMGIFIDSIRALRGGYPRESRYIPQTQEQ